MATTQQPVTIGSHETALCIIPPKHLWASVDRLRMLYDKAYEKWPPHVNLIYPFVQVESLTRASDVIIDQLRSRINSDENNSLHVCLNSADVFPHRHNNTVFICDDDESRNYKLRELRRLILRALGQNDGNYRMHMTLGQSADLDSSPHKFLLEKASLIPAVEWDVEELYILVRERLSTEGSNFSQMKLWGTIKLNDLSLSQVSPLGFYNTGSQRASGGEETQSLPENKRHPFIFSSTSGKWEVYRLTTSIEDQNESPDTLRVASYNVLAEFHYPPSQSRYAILLKNILDESARSDVLVLEEVTDDFLSYLLRNYDIRNEYRFASHGPPDQPDIDPLPSHLNVVVLSKWSFTWNWVSFQRRHKGSVVLQFDGIGQDDEGSFLPVILATVHLTCGLTEGSVAAKKIELQAIVNHLSRTYPRNPWILAGDFNITTSSYTISAALEKKAISTQISKYLENLETMLVESGLSDSWTVARVQNADWTETDETQHQLNEAFEGEQGATFDPTVNDLAARIIGSGFNNRPQRYDRILVKGNDFFSVQGFNMFGRHTDIPDDGETEAMQEPTYGSDHWGIRCSLRLTSESTEMTNEAKQVDISIQPKSAQESLSDIHELKKCLIQSNVFPSEADIESRERALKILEDTLLEKDAEEGPTVNRPLLSFVVAPVGSYGLGVWTPSSDVDCLCIGSISSRTFFALAGQRLRRAAAKGIKVLRRVNANSGTMLELEVLGIKMDLQYCPSTIIAETWPRAMKLAPNDAVFALPTQRLAKLKPARDLYYLRHTIPDFAAFRTAYQFIKTWAKRRGVYAAKFGYLGGIHISILLSRICKILSRNGRPVSVPTIISTFFNHYANFDWKKDIVFDPFFHRHLRYFRTAREAMVILGFHPPSLNTATAASLPSLRTITEELQRADTLLSEEGMTWSRFLGQGNDLTVSGLSEGAADFLKTYKSYVKIDAHFWGVSLAKGSQFVGWLESRCVMLLVDLNRRLPNMHARIWPARFVDKESSDEDKDYQGYYLIGLDKWQTDDGQPMSKDDVKVALSSLQTVLQKFEGQIRGDEKYFDIKSSWMSASVVKQTEVANLRIDGRAWGEYTIGDDESDDEDEQDNEDQIETVDDHSESEFSTSKSSKTRKNDKAIPVRPEYTGKFRSSADVINRLRWDPGLESSDYIVGYEDRFLGAMERPLDQWKTEQTDEEFIPQHRILYFKRRSDGFIVWDRKSRRDDIFGSGVKRVEE